MRNVRVLDETADDLIAARRFYDSIQPGVGDYCADSLIADIESLALFHGIHCIHFGCHRMLANRFPFGIYYIDTSMEIQVVAVLDLRRDPNWIREELTRAPTRPKRLSPIPPLLAVLLAVTASHSPVLD